MRYVVVIALFAFFGDAGLAYAHSPYFRPDKQLYVQDKALELKRWYGDGIILEADPVAYLVTDNEGSIYAQTAVARAASAVCFTPEYCWVAMYHGLFPAPRIKRLALDEDAVPIGKYKKDWPESAQPLQVGFTNSQNLFIWPLSLVTLAMQHPVLNLGALLSLWLPVLFLKICGEWLRRRGRKKWRWFLALPWLAYVLSLPVTLWMIWLTVPPFLLLIPALACLTHIKIKPRIMRYLGWVKSIASSPPGYASGNTG